jgi:hypothetical protein
VHGLVLGGGVLQVGTSTLASAAGNQRVGSRLRICSKGRRANSAIIWLSCSTRWSRASNSAMEIGRAHV